MTTSPSKSGSKAAHLTDPSLLPLPASPQATRTLRRLASHQQLSTNTPSLIAQQRQQQLHKNGPATKTSRDELSQSMQGLALASRTRANSDLPVPQKRPTSRKGPMSGMHARKSSLETLLRDGPPNSDLKSGLDQLRYKVLSARVDASSTGMSEYRIYLWLILLNIPPLPTDEYLSLVHRGKSPADTKIRNDTFRTLATDPLFQRRVTEASITRLLNAVAWKIHDLKLSNPPQPSTPPPPDLSAGMPPTSESALYVQGMNVLSAPFLYASRSETEAYALFYHFILHECPAYIRGAMIGVHKAVSLVDKCLSILSPQLSAHLLSHRMHAEIYAFPSVLTFCACTPPLPEVLHLWDFLFAYGPHLNVLCISAQVLMLKDQLMNSTSPGKMLQKLPPLDSEKIIGLTIWALQKIPEDLYQELVVHAT